MLFHRWFMVVSQDYRVLGLRGLLIGITIQSRIRGMDLG